MNAHQIGQRPVDRHDSVELAVQLAVHAILLAESLALELLPCERAHDADAREIFLQRRGDRAFGVVHPLERSAHPPEEDDREQHDDGQHGNCDERQHRIHPEHQRNSDCQEHQRPRDFNRLAGEHQADRIDITRTALHLIAGLMPVVICHRKMLQVIVQAQPERSGDRLGSERGPAALEIHEHTAGERDENDGAARQDQRGLGARPHRLISGFETPMRAVHWFS